MNNQQGISVAKQVVLPRGKTVLIVFVAIALLSFPGSIRAHPHVWIDAITEFIFDDSQALNGVRVYWLFDELYSTFAVEGLDANGNGKVDEAELAALAAQNIKELKDFRYFTFVEVDGKNPAYGELKEYGMRYVNGRLAMWFTVPLVTSVDPRKAEIAVALYDPTYYIAIDLIDEDPVRFKGEMPAVCGHRIVEAEERSDSLSFSESFFQTLDPSTAFGARYAQWVKVACDVAG